MTDSYPSNRAGTSDPHELRQMAEAWGEDIFPTPAMEHRAFDAAATDVLRRGAVPHLLACAERIEELEAGIRIAAEMADGWHDDTRDHLLGMLDQVTR